MIILNRTRALPQPPMTNFFRLPFLILAIISLLTGLATGLNRMGWDLNVVNTSLHHGAIMVGGFLGTLISLEKVIPLKNRSLYLIPMLSGMSVIFFFCGMPQISFIFLMLASAALTGVFLYYWLEERNIIYVLMVGGALCWMVGNVLLLSSRLYPTAFPWWLGFILLIITAERVELTKFLPVSESNKRWLLFFLIIYIAGVLLSFHAGGQRVSGFALVATSVWLMKYDIVGIAIKKSKLQKFIAVALLCGYISMLLAGIFMLAFTDQVMAYDAIVHTFFLGFAFSMIFAHGPVILPGVLGIAAKPWHPVLYIWLFVLHASWIIRVVADVRVEFALRQASGWLTAACIPGYFLSIAVLTITSQRRHAKVL